MPEGMYILYARRSSDRDDLQMLSIDQQLSVLRELAAVRGLEVAEELTESASARAPGRPVFKDLMKRIREGKVHELLVWRLDRLARNMVDAGEIIYHLSEGNLKAIVTPEATYTSSGDSKFMLAMLFGAAAKYEDDLSQAVRRGNEDALKRGKVPGPVPLGYMKTHEHETVPGSGTVIPDPERFETMKRVWKTFLEGKETVRAIWTQASTDWGLTTRPTKDTLARPVGVSHLYSLLRNPFYAGKILRKGIPYKGEHPPMVTQYEFDRVQELLNKKRPRPHVRAHDFLYHGLLRCGACGRALVGERHQKHSHVYIYYRCSRRRPGASICHSKEVREPDISAALADLFDTITIDPTIRDWAYEAIAWWGRDDEPSPEKMVRHAKAALARAEQELATMTDLIVRGLISEAEYKVRRSNQLVKIAHLREALATPVQKAEAWRALRDEKRANGLHLGKDFREGDDLVKRKILFRVCSGIIVTDGTPHPELKAPFVFRPGNHLTSAAKPLR